MIDLSKLRLIVISAIIRFGEANICSTPKSQEDIRPERFPMTWYVGLHTADPVMHEDVLCSVLRNFTWTSYGASMVVHEYHKNSHPHIFPVHLLKDQKGLYHTANSDAYGIMRSHDLAPDGSFNRDAFETGKFIVWAQFPQPKPRVEQVVNLYNRFKDYGISEKLYFCEDVDFTK